MYDFLTRNWFQIMVVSSIIAGWYIQHRKDAKLEDNHINTIEEGIKGMACNIKKIWNEVKEIKEEQINQGKQIAGLESWRETQE